MTRERIIGVLMARAIQAGRKVYGYSSQYASCAEVKGGKMPPDFDRLCVVGDKEWTSIPAVEGDEP